MSQYFIYYAATNIVGVIIFGILLAHDIIGIDRQEKQVKYDYVLVSFMLYFISDALWAGVNSGVFPVNLFTQAVTCFMNYINMTLISYTWLNYVMAVEQSPHRNRTINKFAVVFPFLLATIVMIVIFLVKPELLFSGKDYKATLLFYGFLLVVPYIYIIAEIVYTMRKALQEENVIERRKHIFIGILPVITVIGGMVQTALMPQLPLFCFTSIIIMLVFYIQLMDSQISTDPLTRLNNRGQLMRYVSQAGNLRMEGRPTFVVMIDINDFKMINDRYGHSEGDSALVIVADALVDVIKDSTYPVFLGRYGGDEFILIAYPLRQTELENMLAVIREGIRKKCMEQNKPYMLSVGIGYDELLGEQDTFQKCMQRADNKLYLNKDMLKVSNTTV